MKLFDAQYFAQAATVAAKYNEELRIPPSDPLHQRHELIRYHFFSAHKLLKELAEFEAQAERVRAIAEEAAKDQAAPL
jgi:hypothetical protein